MKAIVYEPCGSPDVARCEEIEKPRLRDQRVLIRVRAASLNALELSELKGIPYLERIVFGLRKPVKAYPARVGADVSGEVEAVEGHAIQNERCGVRCVHQRSPRLRR